MFNQAAKQYAETAGCLTPTQVNLVDNLTYRQKVLQEQLADVNEAIQALKDNPEIERVLNLITKTGRY